MTRTSTQAQEDAAHPSPRKRQPDNTLLAVGSRIRAERVGRGIGVRELARQLECSPSHVSQVERGIVEPSISLLIGIASRLGISMESLFAGQLHPPADNREDPESARFILHAESRQEIRIRSGVTAQLLLPRPETGLDFCEYVYEPQGASTEDKSLIRHPGREYGVILEGSLKVQIGFEEFTLRAGDSIALESGLPHRFWNDGNIPAKAVWVSTRLLSRTAPIATTPDPDRRALRARGPEAGAAAPLRPPLTARTLPPTLASQR